MENTQHLLDHHEVSRARTREDQEEEKWESEHGYETDHAKSCWTKNQDWRARSGHTCARSSEMTNNR